MIEPHPMSLYEKVLNAADQSSFPIPKPRAPRASSAIILWRGGESIETFWVRRSNRVRFMPGWHAFPGGTLDATDASLPHNGPARESNIPCDAEAMLPSLEHPGEDFGPDQIPGLEAAALRELFEETGILVVAENDPLPNREAWQTEVLSEENFPQILEQNGLTLDTTRLTFAGRWVTPPFSPLRFDTRFYLLEWPREEPIQPQVIDGELADGEWIHPAEALKRWHQTEVLAAPPILHAMKVLAETDGAQVAPRLRSPKEANVGPLRRMEFRPGILMLPSRTATLPPATHTNTFLVGTGECILVDPGSADPGANETLQETLSVAAREGRTVKEIWLTHHHPDHVEGVPFWSDRLKVPLRAHPLTRERLPHLAEYIQGDLIDSSSLNLDGPVPMTVEAFHTPGHASGHLAFWVNPYRSLISGDLVSAISTMVIDPPEGNMAHYLESLERMINLDPKTLFPSHGPVLFPARRFLERTLKHRLKREARVLEGWNQGLRDLGDLVDQAYKEDRLPAFIRPLAKRQVGAHLERLRGIGAIDS